KARHAATAFDGDGARLYGGRWNSRGLAVVYTAASPALAALELLVHLGNSNALARYVSIACRFDEALVLRLDRQRLPRQWQSSPAVPELALVGDAWLKDGTSAVLAVPSAIIPAESNYLLNPNHADFGSIEIGTAQPFELDQRLLR
ncbi:MAG TPA: RES family NAD+ phosphorylase, partial [Vicinamibacterales bacterium]|nr:RES family NAD+ phosphorylase [Vicinamibacterales bacterium]